MQAITQVAFKNINGSSVATPYVRLDSTVVTEKADQGALCLHRSFRSIKTVPNVALTNENAGMMDRLGQTQFEHLSLEAALQEIFNFQTKQHETIIYAKSYDIKTITTKHVINTQDLNSLGINHET